MRAFCYLQDSNFVEIMQGIGHNALVCKRNLQAKDQNDLFQIRKPSELSNGRHFCPILEVEKLLQYTLKT